MIGKQFKFKLLDNAAPRTVVDVRNGFIIFDDDSRVEENRLTGLFDEYSGNNMSESASSINTQPQVRTQESDIVNPDTFFDDSNIVNRISKQASTIDVNSLIDTVDKGGSRTVESPMYQDVEDSPEQVRKVEAKRKDFNKTDMEFAGYDKQGNPIQHQSTINTTDNSTYNSTNEQTGFPLLKQMKRSKKIKLVLNIDESIPKPDFIKMMDENFDSGVIDYLVTDIVSKLLKTPQLIEKQVRETLEEIVYGKKKVVKTPRQKRTIKSDAASKKNVVKKPVVRKKTTRKPTVKNPKSIETNETTDTKTIPSKIIESKEGVSETD